MPDSVTAAVVICTYRRPHELTRALLGVARSSRRPDEVIVVVRDNDADSKEAACTVPGLDVHLAEVHEAGVVAARNVALDRASCQVVAFLDDDAVPRPEWLELLLAHYEDPTVGAAGGRDVVHHDGLPIDEGTRRDVGTLTWYGRLVGLQHMGFGGSRDVDCLKGVNMSIRREYFPDLRLDRSLKGTGAQYHEESSLCFQVRRRGKRVIYDPQVLVDHFEADRMGLDDRLPQAYRPRRDRQHNETFVVAKYQPVHRLAMHLLFSTLIGTGAAPGLLITGRNVFLARSVRGHGLALLANLAGRRGGAVAGLTERPGARQVAGQSGLPAKRQVEAAVGAKLATQ